MSASSGAAYTTLRVDPNQFLGIKYNRYRNQMYKLCLTDNERYYTTRDDFMEYLISDAVSNVFDIIYSVLITGTKPDGSRIGKYALPCEPQLPAQKVNDICCSTAETVRRILENEVLSVILPKDYDDLMNSRLDQRGQAKLMGDK